MSTLKIRSWQSCWLTPHCTDGGWQGPSLLTPRSIILPLHRSWVSESWRPHQKTLMHFRALTTVSQSKDFFSFRGIHFIINGVPPILSFRTKIYWLSANNYYSKDNYLILDTPRHLELWSCEELKASLVFINKPKEWSKLLWLPKRGDRLPNDLKSVLRSLFYD